MKHLVLGLALFFIPVTLTFAQINLGSLNNIGGSEPTIKLEPAEPGPNTEVTASINDFSLQIQATGITWLIDGKKIQGAQDQRSIKFWTKDMNETTVLTAVLETQGKTINLEQKIKPVYLDIIVEPQTRVPGFYHGRALPTVGSKINFTAIINGGEIAPENLTYQWSLNNKVISQGALRSKNKISATISYDIDNTVSLLVKKLNGEVVARRSVSIPSVEPKVLFYEINALYGTTEIPIKRSFNLIGNTGSLHAEPYYLDILTYNRPSVLEWKIDNVRTANNSNNPYEITLARQGGQGSSRVELHVRSLEGLMQGVKGSVNINY